MKRLMLIILFAPLLLIQGWWVRYKTPKLPEPEIEKSGCAGSGSALRLLLLGDSSAAGVGAESPADSLLGQLIERLSLKYNLSYLMVAETGKTTAEVLVDIEHVAEQPFDVVITALGVNDVTSQVSSVVWRQQQIDMIAALKQRFSPAMIVMSGLPPVGDFPALPWPLNAFLGIYADQLDQILQELVEAEPAVTFHSLRGYPQEAMPASDGFHPGPEVYRLWAKYLVEIINKSGVVGGDKYLGDGVVT